MDPLRPICLNSLNRIIPYLGAQELTIQGRGVLSQPRRLTLLHRCCSDSNLEPSWGQLATPYLLWPIGPLWCSMAIWPFLASGHILPSLASLANFHITNRQAFIFDFGPGESFCLLGASRPPSHHLWFWDTPFH
ncbi:hypothetical protein O181_041997 [Austropuccinia psidii MF-1]|uniref:Uncharacterized protein n=1 Tax=Austropuccinia psidii MF-1 TaxID=1389203 RepID=A0A9Q3DHS0_9BASI|nr:hypothetical protein [Austropuccinia psidii MF-1]